MGLGRPSSRLAHLWQWPLLLFSLGLFSYSAYVFIDPKAGPTLAQRIDVAHKLLRQERADAALEQLNLLLLEKLKPEVEGAIRMLLGEAMEVGQRQRRISIPVNHARIIEQTKLALGLGIAPDAETHRRLAESYEALGRRNDSIEHFKLAATIDPANALRWQRRVIDLQLAEEAFPDAAESIEKYLADPDLANSERAWALGEKAHILVDQGKFTEAREHLEQALKLDARGPGEQGQYHYWLGYCAYKLGDGKEAEKFLRVARDQLRVSHPLDADAAYLLGRIKQEQKDYVGANSFYLAVLQSHLDSRIAPWARLGRGVSRILAGDDDAGLTDLTDLVRQVKEKPSLPAKLRDETVAGMKQASEALAGKGSFQNALELMVFEQDLRPKPPAEFFLRLGQIYEKRAAQVEVAGADLTDPERQRRAQQVRDLRSKAGDAYVAYSRGLVLLDDKGYGQALWHGIGHYDAAGDLNRAIVALDTFVTERPQDPLTPDALLKLGQAYQAAGLFDKAISAYRQNQFKYPKSLAASKSAVPLARSYIAKGSDYYKKAEETLLGVIEDNDQINPDAIEFREALLELSRLYYGTARYEQAIARLEELTQRYPKDERMGQMLFLIADSYRKSATTLEEQLAAAKNPAANGGTVDVVEATKARTERLTRGRDLYAQVIDHYRTAGSPAEIDKLYLKHAYFYRADCTFDLNDFTEAIRQYGDAAFRYQDDVASLAAYVQIVNANVSLGKVDEAKAANERAKWVLRRMPPEAFSGSSFGMPRKYWEDWLKWSGESGMWK